MEECKTQWGGLVRPSTPRTHYARSRVCEVKFKVLNFGGAGVPEEMTDEVL